MVGQAPLERYIGVRIPEGQPFQNKPPKLTFFTLFATLAGLRNPVFAVFERTMLCLKNPSVPMAAGWRYNHR